MSSGPADPILLHRRSAEPSAVLHLEMGPEFLRSFIATFGIQGWNSWIRELLDKDYAPSVWQAGEREPPICFWFSFAGADFSKRQWDRIWLGYLVDLEGSDFSGSSLVGAEIHARRGCSFRNADLRQASLEDSDLTSVDFTNAITDGMLLQSCTYHEGHPPIGLPDDLLRQQCRPVPAGETGGAGGTEHPVEVKASLMKAHVPR